tara:strand:+ start:368 stop:637 length:270 start_codon:yes stop_codon:yes gene_type:complete
MEINLTIWKDRIDWETDEVIEPDAEVEVLVSFEEAEPSVGLGENLDIMSANWASDGEEADLDRNDKRGVEQDVRDLINDPTGGNPHVEY